MASGDQGLRGQILATVREAAESLGFEPRVILDGPVDSGIDRRTGTEILATLREALSNVWRHANASHVEVEVVVGRDVCLRVVDDGIGLPSGKTRTGRGLTNMAARATKLGGGLELQPREPHGTILVWRVAARLISTTREMWRCAR